MMTSILSKCSLVGVFCALLLVSPSAQGEEIPKPNPVPDNFVAKLQALFHKHYPGASFTNQGVNGIHVEFEVTTFEFPPVDPTKKHENPVQHGPKKGGILCSVYLERGVYSGQFALLPLGGGQFRSSVIDRKAFKQLLAAPYSPKRDVHLRVSLSWPSDASDDFLKEFRALLKDFEKDAD